MASTTFRSTSASVADKARAAEAYNDPSATLDDLRESVTTLEDTAPIARRVLGSAHPLTKAVAAYLQDAQAALRAREETASSSA